MSDVPPNVRGLLEAHDWGETTGQLVVYTLRKARRLYWQGIRDGDMPEGKEAYDVVQDAIYQLISGERRWDPDIQPDLFAHLQGIIDSKLSALVRSRANRRLRSEAALAAADRLPEDAPSPLDAIASPGPDPVEIALLEEQERRSEEFLIGLALFLEGEPVLQKIVEAIADGAEKPADIAAAAELDTKTVYNARKRLQRRIQEFRVQHDKTRKAS
jgi:DNA-directed RNA polymerase specialized sigma24 family protein